MRTHFGLALALAALVLTSKSDATQTNVNQPLTANYSYADIADLALAASISAHIKIRKAEKLKGALAAGVASGKIRHLITADVIALIRGTDGLAPRVSYLVDVPTDSRGKLPKLTKAEMIIFAVPGRAGEVRLTAPDAQVAWSAPTAQLVRTILSEALRREGPPAITGVREGFHSAGALPGEGETQIFLSTTDERPVSVTVSRVAEAPVRWFISLGEVAGEGVAPPAQNTLLWYRMACFLPKAMPDGAIDGLAADDAAAVKGDYAVVIAGLGVCPRTRR
jgi:hypothetical protein